jgi:uncharacterized protein (TIGR00266 family)
MGYHLASHDTPEVDMSSKQSHEVDYEIFGDDLQFVEVELDPGETVVGEGGTMMFMQDGITFETKMGDGSDPDQGMWGKLKSAGKRAITGESLFLTHFTNTGRSGKVRAGFAAPYPGKIIPIDLHEIGGEIIVQKDGFLCAAMGTKLDIAFQQKIGAGFFGGEGFILQRITGDGRVFLHAGGSIKPVYLDNETLRVDTGCLVALQPQLNYGIERAGNLKSMVFGGEGLFLATISGTGWVWLQSLPFSRVVDRVMASGSFGKTDGESSLLGGVSTIFER